MKVIRKQSIEAARIYTDFFLSKCNISAFNEKTNFWSVFFTVFFETADLTSLLRLFSGNLPAMLLKQCVIFLYSVN